MPYQRFFMVTFLYFCPYRNNDDNGLVTVFVVVQHVVFIPVRL